MNARDVRVAEGRGDARLAQEQAGRPGVALVVAVQHLERHRPVQAEILGQVHVAARAFPQAIAEAIVEDRSLAHFGDYPSERGPVGERSNTRPRRTTSFSELTFPRARSGCRRQA